MQKLTLHVTWLWVISLIVLATIVVTYTWRHPLLKRVEYLRQYVITPTLKRIHLYSPTAEVLLLGTALQESCAGRLSTNIFQITTATARDIRQRFLPTHPQIADEVTALYDPMHDLAWNLQHNIDYQVAIARLIYLQRVPRLPAASNINALGRIWKRYYNTYRGSGAAYQFVRKYRLHTQGKVLACRI